MKHFASRFSLGLILLLAMPSLVSGQDPQGAPGLLRPNRLCSLLENIQPGDRLPVTLEGELSQWGEFTDPREPLCNMNVRQVTRAVLGQGLEAPEELEILYKEHGRAFVYLTGELLGPGLGARPNSQISPLADYSARYRKEHFSGSETKLVINELLRVQPPLAPHHWPLTIFDTTPFPTVYAAAMPLSYPFMAHKIGFSGDVKVQLTIENGQVVKADVLEGDHLLVEDTLANVRTWKFESGVNATFTTTFSYHLERKPAEVNPITVRAQLPLRVEIVAPFHIR